VTEDDGTAEAPVLVEDLGSVSRLDAGHLSVLSRAAADR
jgi:hypothetical protein